MGSINGRCAHDLLDQAKENQKNQSVGVDQMKSVKGQNLETVASENGISVYILNGDFIKGIDGLKDDIQNGINGQKLFHISGSSAIRLFGVNMDKLKHIIECNIDGNKIDGSAKGHREIGAEKNTEKITDIYNDCSDTAIRQILSGKCLLLIRLNCQPDSNPGCKDRYNRI